VGYNTYALSEIDEPAFSGPVSIPADALVSGTNVFAVEVHQSSAGQRYAVCGGTRGD